MQHLIRKCVICKEIKSITAFSKDKTKPTGVKFACKKCLDKKLLDRKRLETLPLRRNKSVRVVDK